MSQIKGSVAAAAATATIGCSLLFVQPSVGNHAQLRHASRATEQPQWSEQTEGHSVSSSILSLGVGGALVFAAHASRKHRGAQVSRGSTVVRRAESIAATAVANGNFKTLVAALTKADLVKTVEGGTFTVFAPTDAAFAILLKDLNVTADQLLANPDLKNILLYHVVSGTAMSSSLSDGQQVGTVQGGKVIVKIAGGKVTVGGATVTAADVACSNGVIHVIDKVLLPPGKFSPANQVGVTAPLGFFDPLGFSKEGDEAGFRNLRASEIKHGRVAMMAALGAVFQHFSVSATAPGMPAGLSAVTTAPAGYGFATLFLASGVLEFTLFKQQDNKEPGNFGDPVGLGDYSTDSRNRELNNGRFAMFAAIGIIAAELLTGKDAIQQFGL